MKLSKRLNGVLQLMNNCSLLADIGCDHGYICIEAVSKGICDKALACDTASGPLSIAQKNIFAAGLNNQIRCVLSDGFTKFTEDMKPECIKITGMGGRLIVRILDGGLKNGSLSDVKQLILGGQSDLDILRHFLIDEAGMHIKRELCIFDDGKYYMLMDTAPGSIEGDSYSDIDYIYGKHIASEGLETYKEYINVQKNKLSLALSKAASGTSQANALKLAKLKERIIMIEKRAKEIEQWA